MKIPRKYKVKARSFLSKSLLGHTTIESRLVNRIIDLDIKNVLDVGANEGQFYQSLRGLGYKGNVISFEPIKDIFERVSQLGASDPNHCALNFALGEHEGEQEINIASNKGASSSLLNFKTEVLNEMGVNQVGKEKIFVQKLDKVLDTIPIPFELENCALKIDVQGYEVPVLNGAKDTLKSIKLIFLEASFSKLYEGEPLIFNVLQLLDSIGFEMVDIQPSLFNGGYAPWQCDVILVKKNA